MANKNHINYEKISVYIAICASLFTMIHYLFQIKDEISGLRERIAVVEVRNEDKKKCSVSYAFL